MGRGSVPCGQVVGELAVLWLPWWVQEFIRVGYYVNNDYADDEALRDNQPDAPVLERCRGQ
jgi:hypothetical protein